MRSGRGCETWRPSVLIVDDHARFRETARRALERDGWTIAGEAADGAEGAAGRCRALEPDVVLWTSRLPGMNGLEVARRLRDWMPQLVDGRRSRRTDSADYHDLAVASGARGFIAKAELTGAALHALLTG